MGATDVEVIPGLARLGWTTLLVAVGPAASRYRSNLRTATATAWLPPIPVIGPAIANLHAALLTLRWRPDVIVVNPGMAIAGALCAVLAPTATVVTDVRSIPVETGAGLRRRLAGAQFRLACNLPRLRGLTAITGGTIDILRRDHGLKTSVPTDTWSSGARLDFFHPGVDPVDAATIGLPPDSIVFVYHGVLSADRGLLTLVDAFRQVHAAQTRAHLLLLGDGPAVPTLRERAAALGVERAVTLVPSVPIERVPAYLAAADIAVIALPDIDWWRVSSPMKLYEYLAMGLPVIATDIEPHRGVEGVLLCPPTAAGLALAMSRSMEHPLPAAPDPSRYSWDRQAERLSTFLHRLRRA